MATPAWRTLHDAFGPTYPAPAPLPSDRAVVRRRPGFRVTVLAVPALVLDRGAHEVAEQRVRLHGLGLELGVELHADEPGMVRQFDDLDQVVLRVHAGHHHARVLQALAVGVVQLEPVPVALADLQRAV